MSNTLNVYARYGGDYSDVQIKQVWLGFPERLPVGITVEDLAPGTLIPAGTPIYSEDDQSCKIYTEDIDGGEDKNLPYLRGLLFNDVYVDENGKDVCGTACVVTHGTIRVNILDSIPQLTDGVKDALRHRITFYQETTVS